MGCTRKLSYDFVKVLDFKPAAADCDYEFFAKQIQDVTAKAVWRFSLFNMKSAITSVHATNMRMGFHVVADAGATVVMGSQAHYPHLMEFCGDLFIHFGLAIFSSTR